MKFTRVSIVLASLVFPAHVAISAEQVSDVVKLRFVEASEVYDAVKQQLG